MELVLCGYIDFPSSTRYIDCLFAASTIRRGPFFGPGTGPIHLGSLQCAGTERNVTECPHGSTDQCTHANDAGVTCRASMRSVFVELATLLM